MPDFPGFPRIATRIFENPVGRADVQKVEFAGFSRLFWMIGLRKRAEVELRSYVAEVQRLREPSLWGL